MAKAAGVSQPTVSYVLSGRTDQTIRPETRRKILEAAESLGYRPNLAARSLVTGATGVIALWVPYTYHSVYSQVIRHVMNAAGSDGYRVAIVQINNWTENGMTPEALLEAAHVDGVLAFDATRSVEGALDRPSPPPIVSFGPQYTDVGDYVGLGLYEGGLLAMNHLWEIGCRRIAYAAHSRDMSIGDYRYRAYMHVAEEKGLTPELIPLALGEYEDSYAGVKAHVETHGHPDGLFCWNDETAIGANRALLDLSLRIPDDVAVIGCDGIRETAFTEPQLSTLAQPFEEMCGRAWEFLKNRVKDPARGPQQVVLPLDLVKRRSSLR